MIRRTFLRALPGVAALLPLMDKLRAQAAVEEPSLSLDDMSDCTLTWDEHEGEFVLHPPETEAQYSEDGITWYNADYRDGLVTVPETDAPVSGSYHVRVRCG